jgi:putative ABC transport system ATP-binding protein
MTFSDFPKDERQKRAKEALEIVGLYTRKEHRPFQLSGGQQQRVSIARAIASTPDVLVADEPTGNLDSKMSEQIMEIIQSINENGTTVIMVTHNDTHADLAQNKIHILDGEIQEIIRK